jgi:hypothetical protein
MGSVLGWGKATRETGITAWITCGGFFLTPGWVPGPFVHLRTESNDANPDGSQKKQTFQGWQTQPY